MRRNEMSFRRALVAGIAVVVATASATASAQTVTCGGTMPSAAGAMFTATPIYITGSTALEPLIKSFGPKLASQMGTPYVLIYLKDGSCARVNRIKSDGTIPPGKTNIYI